MCSLTLDSVRYRLFIRYLSPHIHVTVFARQAKSVQIQHGCEATSHTPRTAAILTLSVTVMSASAGLRSGPAAFKDPALAHSTNRSAPRSRCFAMYRVPIFAIAVTAGVLTLFTKRHR